MVATGTPSQARSSPATSSPTSSASRSRLLAPVLTGTYAWGLTVLPPIAVQGPLSLAGVAAGLALLSLLISPLLPPGRLALTAALDVFVGLCLLSWWAGRDQPIDPPLALFGSFGWLAYTFALGSLSTPRDLNEEASPGPHLDARTPPSRLSAIAISLVLVCCLILLGAAWKVERPALAVLAHVLALATVLLLLRSGAHLAIFIQVRGTKLERALLVRAALWPLLALLALVASGLGWSLLFR